MKLYFSHVYWGSAFVVILSLVSVVSPLECRIGDGRDGCAWRWDAADEEVQYEYLERMPAGPLREYTVSNIAQQSTPRSQIPV